MTFLLVRFLFTLLRCYLQRTCAHHEAMIQSYAPYEQLSCRVCEKGLFVKLLKGRQRIYLPGLAQTTFSSPASLV